MVLGIGIKFNFRDFMPWPYQFFGGSPISEGVNYYLADFFSAEGVHNGVLHQIKLKMDQKGLKMDQRLKLD